VSAVARAKRFVLHRIAEPMRVIQKRKQLAKIAAVLATPPSALAAIVCHLFLSWIAMKAAGRALAVIDAFVAAACAALDTALIALTGAAVKQCQSVYFWTRMRTLRCGGHTAQIRVRRYRNRQRSLVSRLRKLTHSCHFLLSPLLALYDFLCATLCHSKRSSELSMSTQTPQFSLTLEFDEHALQRLLVAFERQITTAADAPRQALVPLRCTLRNEQGDVCLTFTVDAAHIARARLLFVNESDCGERTFYYINGLLNALRRVHFARKEWPVRALKIITCSRYLQYNAQCNRVARWRKNAFKKADGEPVLFRELWNEFYGWCTGPLRFEPLSVVNR
jgi:hypothetical protein